MYEIKINLIQVQRVDQALQLQLLSHIPYLLEFFLKPQVNLELVSIKILTIYPIFHIQSSMDKFVTSYFNKDIEELIIILDDLCLNLLQFIFNIQKFLKILPDVSVLLNSKFLIFFKKNR